MKIFATSDIHGNKVIIDKMESVASSVDMTIICGDIGGKDFHRGDTLLDVSMRQKKDAEHLVKRMDALSLPFRYILGNDDWFECTGRYYLQETETISGYDLVPIEFVLITPFNTNREVNENKLRYELDKLRTNEKSVVVAHTPPRYCGDTLYNGTHVGSRSVLEWISDVQPKIWLCGHIHEDNSVNKIGETLVFNCACDHMKDELRGWIVDLDSMTYERIEI
jgi:Icc-related predicted phosphoesterase